MDSLNIVKWAELFYSECLIRSSVLLLRDNANECRLVSLFGGTNVNVAGARTNTTLILPTEHRRQVQTGPRQLGPCHSHE